MLSSAQFLFRSGTCTYFWMLLLAPACALHTVELGEAASSGKATRREKRPLQLTKPPAARRETQANLSPFQFGPCFLVCPVRPGPAWPGSIIPAENQYNPSRALRLASRRCVCECCVESRANRPPTRQTSQDPLRRRRWTMDGRGCGAHTVQRFRGTLETKTSPDEAP